MITKLNVLIHNKSFMKYFKNSSWMMFEYALRFISAIFVSIYIARYLGPEQFGVLSYAIAIVAIFMTVSRLGMETILVRDLAKYPEQTGPPYKATAFKLLLGAALAGFIALSVLVYYFESDENTKVYIWIIALGLLFQPLLVVDYSFQAQVKSKYSSIAKSIALAISSAIKIYLIYMNASLEFFAVAYAIDHMLIALSLVVMHFSKKQFGFVNGYDGALVRPLLKSAWPMVLSAAAAMLYMKMDQILIMNLIGSFELGIYSAGVKLFEGWATILFVLTISLFPLLVKAYEVSETNFNKLFIKISGSIFFINLVSVVLIGFFAEELIFLLFGEGFLEAAEVLFILFVSVIFTGFGFLTSRYFMVKGLEVRILKRTLLGLVLNLPLNLLLIPNYGIVGAAYATLISLFIANFAVDFIDDRYLFILKLRSLNFFYWTKL